jgi:hypothetical protein
MTSNFEVKALGKLAYENAIENAQKSRIARSVKKPARSANGKTR